MLNHPYLTRSKSRVPLSVAKPQEDITLDCRPSDINAINTTFRRMGRQVDTINRLLKLFDKEAIAEIYGNDDGPYNAIALTVL